jgi:nucleotide-binding universal stress UspA family protein
MPIKSILVVVSGAEESNPALALAFTLAQKYTARIAALYVKPVVMVYSDGMGFDMTPSVIEAQQAYLQSAADKAESVTKAQAAQAGYEIEWRCEEGDELNIAAAHARVSDIVLANPEVARDLMFEAGIPVLAVPHGASADLGKRVLVAWNGSRECARAVRDARDLLKKAEQVLVAVFDPPHGKGMGHDIAALLASQGANVSVREMLSDGDNIGNLLLQEAKANGCGLIVMGGYGHSRFREWVLGGVTDAILHDAQIPVLLSH